MSLLLILIYFHVFPTFDKIGKLTTELHFVQKNTTFLANITGLNTGLDNFIYAAHFIAQ